MQFAMWLEIHKGGYKILVHVVKYSRAFKYFNAITVSHMECGKPKTTRIPFK